MEHIGILNQMSFKKIQIIQIRLHLQKKNKTDFSLIKLLKQLNINLNSLGKVKMVSPTIR
jgi:hypothetical protein